MVDGKTGRQTGRPIVFTSWGIIKSHCYIGGIHAMAFDPSDEHLLLAGMGANARPDGRKRPTVVAAIRLERSARQTDR